MIGARADLWGIAGHDPERVYEIAALMAAAGEQLGLAALADYEVSNWAALKPAGSRDRQIEREMATRAVVELESHYVLATGHALGNLAGRVCALDPAARDEIKKRLKTDYAPGATDKRSWSFLRVAATELPKIAAIPRLSRDLQAVSEAIAELHDDPRWQSFETLRGEDFHQWRPQTVGIRGAAKKTFGDPVAAGDPRRVYSFRGGTDLSPSEGARLAQAGWHTTKQAMNLLPPAMDKLFRAIRPVLERLTFLVFEESELAAGAD